MCYATGTSDRLCRVQDPYDQAKPSGHDSNIGCCKSAKSAALVDERSHNDEHEDNKKYKLMALLTVPHRTLLSSAAGGNDQGFSADHVVAVQQ